LSWANWEKEIDFTGKEGDILYLKGKGTGDPGKAGLQPTLGQNAKNRNAQPSV